MCPSLASDMRAAAGSAVPAGDVVFGRFLRGFVKSLLVLSNSISSPRYMKAV